MSKPTELSDMVSARGRPGVQTGEESKVADDYGRDGLGRDTDVNTEQIENRARMSMEDRDVGERPGKVQPQEQQGETKEDADEETKEPDAGDNLGEDLADDGVNAGADGAEGASNLATGLGEGAEDLAETGASTLGDLGGMAAGESALADAAAATSWIPFVGEVLGGIAAVGGLVAAGVGIYDDIKGGGLQQKADDMASSLKKSQLPSVSVAGAYSAPLASSVNV